MGLQESHDAVVPREPSTQTKDADSADEAGHGSEISPAVTETKRKALYFKAKGLDEKWLLSISMLTPALLEDLGLLAAGYTGVKG